MPWCCSHMTWKKKNVKKIKGAAGQKKCPKNGTYKRSLTVQAMYYTEAWTENKILYVRVAPSSQLCRGSCIDMNCTVVVLFTSIYHTHGAVRFCGAGRRPPRVSPATPSELPAATPSVSQSVRYSTVIITKPPRRTDARARIRTDAERTSGSKAASISAVCVCS